MDMCRFSNITTGLTCTSLTLRILLRRIANVPDHWFGKDMNYRTRRTDAEQEQNNHPFPPVPRSSG